MSAVWARVRVDLRRRVWATASLVLVVAIAAGVVMAAVAGARRTGSAMDRFATFVRPEDVFVQTPDGAIPEQVGNLPQVSDSTRTPFVYLVTRPDGTDAGSVVPFAAADDRAFRTMERTLVVRGRQPHLDAPDEVVVNELAARRLHLGVGSSLRMYAFSFDQILASATSGGGPPGAPTGPTYTFRVVGIVREPADVNPGPESDVVYQGQQVVALTPAFLRAYAADLGVAPDDLPGMEGVRVRLRHGLSDLDAFTVAARPLIGPQGQILTGSDTADAAAGVNEATHFQAIALFAFAGLAALTVVLVVGQALARQVALDATDHAALRSLGMTTGQRALVAMGRAAVVTVAGSLLGVAVALALSPLFPFGVARQAEIHPGATVDAVVLALGVLASLVTLLLRAGASAWRASAPVRPALAGRRSRVADALARAGLPTPAITGVRMSLERPFTGTAVPVRSAMVATTTAVTGVVAALVFAASLGLLVTDQRQQGWNFDVMVGNPNSQGDVAVATVPALAANPAVGGFSGLIPMESLSLGGHQTDAMAIDPERGAVFPTVVEGRAPNRSDEVLVGTVTLRRIGRQVGDTVEAQVGDRRETLRVVGRAVFPAGPFSGPMNKGLAIPADGARALSPDLDTPKVFAVRYAPEADPATARASLEHDFPRLVLGFTPAGEVQNLRRVRGLPAGLAALGAVLGCGVLAHALVTGFRRRRRDLAMLKTLGFVRRQVSATVAWEATTLAVVALVVGLPLGVAVGRWAWELVVAQMGSRSGAAVPGPAIAAAAVATLAAANLLAAGPGWMAGRLRPAAVLRAE